MLAIWVQTSGDGKGTLGKLALVHPIVFVFEVGIVIAHMEEPEDSVCGWRGIWGLVMDSGVIW